MSKAQLPTPGLGAPSQGPAPAPGRSAPTPGLPVGTPGTSAAADAPATGAPDYSDTFYGQVGGHETFAKIIRVFYEGVAADPVLRAMYPEEDLGPAERRMLLFTEQYWGGPRTYLEERGHPRLRMRHMPFAVTPEARDRWLDAMRQGIDSVNLAPLQRETLWDYMERAAHSMVNAPSDPGLQAPGL